MPPPRSTPPQQTNIHTVFLVAYQALTLAGLTALLHLFDLTESVTTVMGCPEIQEKQYERVFTALSATTEFELNGTQLLLTGDDTRVVLEMNNAQ